MPHAEPAENPPSKGALMQNSSYIPTKLAQVLPIKRIYTIHYLELNKDFRESSETHEFFELVFVDKGKLFLNAGEHTIYLNEGDLYIHKPYEEHSFRGDKIIPSNVFIISFDCASPNMIFFEDKVFRSSADIKRILASIISESDGTFDLTFNNPKMKKLKKKKSAIFGSEQMIGLLLESLLIYLFREKQDADIHPFLSKDCFEDEKTVRIIDYLENHLYEPIKMQQISQTLQFGDSYLEHHFKKITHYTIFEYYNILKITEAKKLIRKGELSMEEISRKLDYCNQHYFSTMFRKVMNMTPSEYKKSIRSIEQTEQTGEGTPEEAPQTP